MSMNLEKKSWKKNYVKENDLFPVISFSSSDWSILSVLIESELRRNGPKKIKFFFFLKKNLVDKIICNFRCFGVVGVNSLNFGLNFAFQIKIRYSNTF